MLCYILVFCAFSVGVAVCLVCCVFDSVCCVWGVKEWVMKEWVVKEWVVKE